MEDQVSEQARRVLALVDVNPTRAAKQATRLAARSRLAHDFASASVAERAAGLAALHTTGPAAALKHLRSAVQSGRRARSRRLVGEARMSLAFALNHRGDTRRALRMIDLALADLSGLERARATAQRGAIRHQLGALDDALADYRAALPTLRRHADWRWVQRLHSNRGVLLIYRSQLAAATAELAEAERVCREAKLDLQLALVYDNIAFLHIRKGDVPAALHWLDRAESKHRAVGAQPGTILVDRSELLLSVGLVGEARQAATRAVEEFARLRRRILLPQAQLLLAETTLLDGDPAAARALAETACRGFRAQRRTEWMALARYTALRCRMSQPGARRVTAAELTRAAAHLERAGWTIPALDARLVAARAALASGDPVPAKDLPAAARRRGPAELRARMWHAEALRRLAAGRTGSAAVALQAGIRVLEDHQATMPAADLRSTVSSHRTDLVALGTRLALTGGRPHQVLMWAERGRATALRMQPLRPPDDPVLAQLLVELRAAEGRAARQAGIERAIRNRARAIGGPTTVTRLPSVPDLRAALGDAALVEYVEQDGRLFAVTVTGSRVRLTPLGDLDRVPPLLQQVPFALRRLVDRAGRAAGRGTVAAASQLLDRACRDLDALLLAPLRSQIGDRPLVIVPTGPLQSVLWSALPSCAGRPVTVAPSAALWYQAARAAPRPGHVVVAAGPDLPAAPAEAAKIAGLYRDVRLLLGDDARVGETRAALRGSSIAHIAAHGSLRADNPLFSSLRLSDGPLTVYDLDTLGTAPRLVVLAACDGALSYTVAGDEVLGLAAGFLAHGTVALIGPLTFVPDEAMAELMVDLHTRLCVGESPAAALMGTRTAAGDGPPAIRAAAASLTCLGAGLVP